MDGVYDVVYHVSAGADDVYDVVYHVSAGADGVVDGSPDEVVTIVAGTYDRSGLSGDGGPATDARLRGPTEVTASGDRLLVLDTWNYRVRQIER